MIFKKMYSKKNFTKRVFLVIGFGKDLLKESGLLFEKERSNQTKPAADGGTNN
jgi:hypothetical protein